MFIKPYLQGHPDPQDPIYSYDKTSLDGTRTDIATEIGTEVKTEAEKRRNCYSALPTKIWGVLLLIIRYSPNFSYS